MLYWKYSDNRVFFLNEYWILIPIMGFANYVIIRKIRSYKNYKKKLELLEKLQKREKAIRRILYLSLGLNGYAYILLTRGGSDLIDVSYIQCDIEPGVGFLNHDQLRNIIIGLYHQKHRGKIIYIMATAACHLAHQYGLMFLNVPFAVNDFGLTSVYHLMRKTFATLFLGSVVPLIYYGSQISLFFASTFLVSGMRLALNYLDVIPTTLIDDADLTKKLKPRMPGSHDVGIINSRDKLTMASPQPQKMECCLPDQTFANKNCGLKSTELPTLNVGHDDVVNMKDITGLNQQDFSDKLDLGQAESETLLQ